MTDELILSGVYYPCVAGLAYFSLGGCAGKASYQSVPGTVPYNLVPGSYRYQVPVSYCTVLKLRRMTFDDYHNIMNMKPCHSHHSDENEELYHRSSKEDSQGSYYRIRVEDELGKMKG